MIQLKNFSLRFDERTLLDNINADFPKGKLIALIGKNGTGKSTMLKAICGLNKNYTGDILIDGENIKKISQQDLAKILAFVNTQRPRMANLRCNDVVALGRTPYTNWHGKLSDNDQTKIKEAIEMVGMSSFASKYFNQLSDGESQKIMVARAIAQDPELLILDEPTSFLDLPTRHELAALLRLLTEKGKSVIFSTHELDIALKYADYIAVIENENLLILPPSEIQSTTSLPSLLNFLP